MISHLPCYCSRLIPIQLLIEGTYVTESEPDVVRSLRRTRIVRVTLPMAVNVQDFFRSST